MDEIQSLKQRIAELENFKMNLEAASTIPLLVDQAFRVRFASGTTLTTSGKSSSSENQSVSESGSASYTVMKNPDGFLEVNILGTVYYIPIFTS